LQIDFLQRTDNDSQILPNTFKEWTFNIWTRYIQLTFISKFPPNHLPVVSHPTMSIHNYYHSLPTTYPLFLIPPCQYTISFVFIVAKNDLLWSSETSVQGDFEKLVKQYMNLRIKLLYKKEKLIYKLTVIQIDTF